MMEQEKDIMRACCQMAHGGHPEAELSEAEGSQAFNAGDSSVRQNVGPRNDAKLTKLDPGLLRAQAILEFTVSTIVFVMLAYGMVKIMSWAAGTIAAPRAQHEGCVDDAAAWGEARRYTNINIDCGGLQINSMNAVM